MGAVPEGGGGRSSCCARARRETPMSSSVLYARETAVDVTEFRRVLVESGLARVRPVHDEHRLAALISGANLIVTARLNNAARPLVGIARCISDFSWCCYVSDLAVAGSAQGKGI